MLNKVILMGRLTADPVLRHTSTNVPVASFSLAVDRNYNNRGETDFFDIVSWNRTAEFVTNYFHRGQLVAVTGHLQVRNWTDKEGNQRRTYEVIAEEVYFAESKRSNTSSQYDVPQPRPAASPDPYSASPVIPEDPSGFSDLSEDDDELPF